MGRVGDDFERVLGAKRVRGFNFVEFGDVGDVVPGCSGLFGAVEEGGVDIGASVLGPCREAIFNLPDVYDRITIELAHRTWNSSESTHRIERDLAKIRKHQV